MFDAERHAVEHRNAHRVEVAGRDDAAIDEDGLAVRLRLSRQLHAHEHVAASEWKAVDERGPLHPRQCRQPRQRLVDEPAARSRIAIPRGGQRDAAGEHLVRREPRIDRGEREEASREQTATDEQHHRERDFDHDERVADASGPAAGDARPFAQELPGSAPRHTNDGDGADEQRGHNRRHRRKPRDAPVESHTCTRRQTGPAECRYRPERPPCEQRARAAAPTVASVALSMNSWAASRACVAPSEVRTAISLSRSAERASSMWPTLAQATTSRRQTAASSTISGVRTSRLTRSLSGIDRSSAPVLVVRIVARHRRADRGELLLRPLVVHTVGEPSDDVHHGYRARRAIRVQRKRQPDLGAGRLVATPWMP